MNLPLRTPASVLFIISALVAVLAALQAYGGIALPQFAPHTTLAALLAWGLLAIGCLTLTNS